MNKTLENFKIFHTVSTYPVCTFIKPEFPALLMSYPVLVQANLFPFHSSYYYPIIAVFQFVISQAGTCQNVALHIFIISPSVSQAVYTVYHNALGYPPEKEDDCECESKK